MQDSTNAIPSRFAVEKISPDELTKRLSRQSTRLDCELVILPGLSQVPSGLPAALAGFARRGGGLLLFLNDDVSPSRYNEEFGELLPGQLGHPERPSSSDAKWHLDDYERKAPMFDPFRRPGSGNLALPEFSRRFSISPNAGTAVTARFEDDVPAIVSAKVGQGKVVLANTSADTAWTDWPKHKTFVPWLHSLCSWVAARTGAEPPRARERLVVGSDRDIALGAGAKNQSFRFQRPGEKESILTADGDGQLRNLDFSKPGIYGVIDRGGQELLRLAVNPPAQESDLAALTPNGFQAQLARAAEPRGAATASVGGGADNQQKELARWLLLAGLALLLAEAGLANRTYA
jgi:hypothetical protein